MLRETFIQRKYLQDPNSLLINNAYQSSQIVPLSSCFLFLIYSTRMQSMLSHMSQLYYRIPTVGKNKWFLRYSSGSPCKCSICEGLDKDIDFLLSFKKDSMHFSTYRSLVDLAFSLQGIESFDSRFIDPLTDVFLYDI